MLHANPKSSEICEWAEINITESQLQPWSNINTDWIENRTQIIMLMLSLVKPERLRHHTRVYVFLLRADQGEMCWTRGGVIQDTQGKICDR